MPDQPPEPLRVLLVDDESAASSWLADLLSRHEHVTVIGRATSVARAEQLIAVHRPDVVFIDIEMPGRDGLSLLDRLDAIHWRWQGGTLVSFVGSAATLTLRRAATRRLKDQLDGQR